MKNSTSIILSSMSTVALTILLLSNQPSSTLALTNHHVNVNVNTSPSRGGILGSAAPPPQYSHYLPSHTNRNRNRKSNLSMASSSNDSSSSTTTQSSVSPQALEPLAKEGPWQAFLDESTTGLIYYFNSNTGESMWDPPTKTFPKIRMTRKEKRRMMSIRKEYAEVQRLEMEERELELLEKTKREKIGGFFGGLWNNNKKKEVVDEDDASTVPLNANEALNGNVGTNGGSNVEQQQVQEEVQPQQPAFTVPDLGGLMANFAPSEQSTSSPTATTTEPEQVSNEPEPEYYYEEEEEYFEAPVVAKPLRVEVASRVLPHPEKISWGGEDALFSQGRTFGVFDGVSGAEKEAGIPLYSVTLSRQLKATVGKKGLTTDEMQAKLLAAAELADDTATGASTAILASMGEDGFLRVLNVGDSTLLVIRNGIVASKSKEIVHYFDCPYQLSSDSPDRPKDGTIMNVEIVPGDVIVTGSDGIFDNLSDEAICEIVSSKKGSTMSLAKRITDESRKISLDTEAATPYAKLAKRNRYPEYKSGLGGKVDDISCVVVRCT